MASVSLTKNELRSLIRIGAVSLLSGVALLSFALVLLRVSSPFGSLGYQTNNDGVVTSIIPGSPAARAGILTGDRIDPSGTPPEDRIDVIGVTFIWQPGHAITVTRVRDNIRTTMRLVAQPLPVDNALDAVLAVVTVIAASLFVILGASLTLLRPSITTWGFFVYCLTAEPAGWYAASTLPHLAGWITYTVLSVGSAAGMVGLLVFALTFLSDPLPRWRIAMLRSLPALLLVLVALQGAEEYQTYWAGGPPAESLGRINEVLFGLLSVIVFGILLLTYARSQGVDKQRIRWVVVGFGVSLVASYVFSLTFKYLEVLPGWYVWGEPLIGLVVPLTITYAVIKHRVIDVSFFVSRALVYAVLTGLLIGIFSLFDWLFVDWLRATSLGVVAEIGAALAIGFWINSLHRRIDSFIDMTFFRRRHAAEKALGEIARALPLASNARTVAESLVVEPQRLFTLASAALFRQRRGDDFMLTMASGWESSTKTRLDADDDRLLMLLRSAAGPVSLYDHPWQVSGLPQGAAHPVLAIPVLSRHELIAIVLYGSHSRGESLDPDEVRCLSELARGAAIAYERLESEGLRRRISELEHLVHAAHQAGALQAGLLQADP